MTPRRGTARLSSALELRYVEHGDRDGTPVVCLHAYVDSWRSFGAMLPHLPASLRAVAPTQRGHGDSGKPASGYAADDFAGDLAAFLDVVGIERAVLVASSSAVFTVTRFAELDPERVLGLVLLGAPWSLREVPAVRRFLAEVSELTDPVGEEYVRSFVSATAGEAVPADFVEEQVRESLEVPARVWRETLEGLVDPSATRRHHGACTHHLGRPGRVRIPSGSGAAARRSSRLAAHRLRRSRSHRAVGATRAGRSRHRRLRCDA